MKEVDVEVQQNSEEVQQEEVEKVEDDVLEDVVTEETEVQITDEDEKESAKRLETLEEKRSIVNNDADKHRKLRDEYHAMTKEWKSKRDALNSQVRELVTDAGKCRDERDQFNTLVREAATMSGADRLEVLMTAEDIMINQDQALMPMYFYTTNNMIDTTKWGGWYPNTMDYHPTKDVYLK